jgi:hypothetical protein
MGTHFIPSSIQGLFGGFAVKVSRAEQRTEQIRQFMVDCIKAGASLKDFPHIERRLLSARDVEALWYLRGDVLAALCDVLGEHAARRKLDEITSMFNGLLPRSMFSKPRSFGN